MKRFLVIIAVIFTLFSLSSCSTEINAIISDPSEGTPSFMADEGYENLFDYDINTKWCVTPFDGAYVIWKTSEVIKPNGYIIVTANDAETYNGRNPAVWTLYGSYAETLPGRKSTTWEVIDHVADRTILTDTNYTEHYFDVSTNSAYDFYKLEIEQVQSGNVMQIAEFAIQYKGGDYVFDNSLYDNTHRNTTDYGDDEYITEDYEPTNDFSTTESSYLTTQPPSSEYSDVIYTPNEGTFYRYYELLNENEKTIYRQLCNAIESFETQIIPACSINTDRIKIIYDYLLCDHPEYFWLNKHYSWEYTESTGTITKIILKYYYKQSVVPTMQLQIDKAVDSICADITDDFTEYDIALHVYEQLIDLIDYDTVALQIEDSEENSTTPDTIRSIYGALINRKAVCAGYAYATQYILQKYGIECSTILNDTHAWNLVKLEGDYYYIDTTWGDPSNTDPLKESSGDISYLYFCMTTDTLNSLKSHEIPDYIFVPECTSTACNYFIRNGIYFEYLDTDKLNSLFDKSISKGGEEFSFICADETCYNEIKTHLFEEDHIWDYVKPACNKYGYEQPETIYNTTYDSNYIIKIYFTSKT